MSEENKRPHYLVQSVAEQIVANFEPYCQRIEIAGSLRRKKEMVGDIEIVAIPIVNEQKTLWGKTASNKLHFNKLLNHVDHLLKMQKIGQAKDSAGRHRWGEKMRSIALITDKGEKYKIDLFMCTEVNWGNIFLIRTGSRAFSKWMVTKTTDGGGMPVNMRQLDGRLWEYIHGAWEPLEIREEEEWFDVVGVPYVQPEYRHEGLWYDQV